MKPLARAGRLVIIGSRPRAVFGVDASVTVDPGHMLQNMLEIHGSRYNHPDRDPADPRAAPPESHALGAIPYWKTELDISAGAGAS